MKRAALAVIALALAAAADAPGAALRPHVRFAAPAGWRVEEHANGVDPVLRFTKGLDVITLYLYGAKGTAYATPEAFLRGPAASTMGSAPKADGRVTVAGLSLVLYRRGYPVRLGDPHVPASGAAPEMASERFIVLPLAGSRFAVAAHAFESSVPSFEREGARAFDKFLKALRPAPAPKPRK
jgi:hypothetical protein